MSDGEQDEMSAYVTEVCSQCGSLKSVCSDPERSLYPQRSVCYVTATAQAVDRRVRDHHGAPDAKSVFPHFTDGSSTWMSQFDLTPDEDFGGALGVSADQQALSHESQSADSDE